MVYCNTDIALETFLPSYHTPEVKTVFELATSTCIFPEGREREISTDPPLNNLRDLQPAPFDLTQTPGKPGGFTAMIIIRSC